MPVLFSVWNPLFHVWLKYNSSRDLTPYLFINAVKIHSIRPKKIENIQDQIDRQLLFFAHYVALARDGLGKGTPSGPSFILSPARDAFLPAASRGDSAHRCWNTNAGHEVRLAVTSQTILIDDFDGLFIRSINGSTAGRSSPAPLPCWSATSHRMFSVRSPSVLVNRLQSRILRGRISVRSC